MRRSRRSSLSFDEKEFYLDEFHEKSLLFAFRAKDWVSESDIQNTMEVIGTLLRNDTRILLLQEIGCGTEDRRYAALWNQYLTQLAGVPRFSPVTFSVNEDVEQLCLKTWEVLRDTRLFAGIWPSEAPMPLVNCAERIAVGLRIYKLVYVDGLGGLAQDGNAISFLNGAGLQDLLRPGCAEDKGLGSRRPVLEAVHAALQGGVLSVSLCPPEGLGRELFTYDGCGTLFTRGDYCQVEKLSIDDFHEVERLLLRAERAGYLKPRTPQETAQLLLHGYGARLGPVTMEPAGFCALFPYPKDHAAEIVGLFTITRYQGEGVGGQLVKAMVQEGERQGLNYVFACTNQEGAQRLFERHGFRRVNPDAVAAAKWYGYDPERRRQVAVYRRDLAQLGRQGTLYHYFE